MRGPGHGAGTSPEYRIRAGIPLPAGDVTAGPAAVVKKFTAKAADENMVAMPVIRQRPPGFVHRAGASLCGGGL
ncbi:hypothetical protein StoSoilB20_26290 [Arthrobacter sp. StoSoilB20]|nr:hypothetical protein StoSoilB20_26290 [Arthrobacter sp. StoSoilB20]